MVTIGAIATSPIAQDHCQFSMQLSEQASIGCLFGGNNIIMSTVNVNDGPVNFSQSIVLGLENPFQLKGPVDAYKVQCHLI